MNKDVYIITIGGDPVHSTCPRVHLPNPILTLTQISKPIQPADNWSWTPGRVRRSRWSWGVLVFGTLDNACVLW